MDYFSFLFFNVEQLPAVIFTFPSGDKKSIQFKFYKLFLDFRMCNVIKIINL